MGKLIEFNLTLKDNKVVYSPGESLSGTLNISTAQDLPCKDIKVNCQGFCGVTSKPNDTAWTVEEQYFSSTLSVADKGTLKRGEHTFPFKFLLPASAPTSFEGNYGKVMYRVRAFIDTPRFSKDYKTEKPFYLLSLFNLNEVPDIHGPSSSAVTKKFTYLLVKTGTVELKAQTDMKGYTPGQVIKITAEIHNQSGKTTGAVVASLMQKVTYQTKKPTIDIRILAQVEGAGVKAGKQAEWKEQIIVPPLPQSLLAGCDLINIEYFIQISLKFPETSFLLPIHIGNISVDTTSARPSRPPPPNPDSPGSCKIKNDRRSEPSSKDQGTPLPTTPAPRPGPVPAPRNRLSLSSPSAPPSASPSAPPAEMDYQLMGAGGQTTEALPTKSHSQLDTYEPLAPVSPSAFSYAPGLTFSQNQRQIDPSNTTGPLFCLATGATIPFFSDGGANPMPTLYPLLPPDYSSSTLPNEAPPSYVESCSSNT
ncbi:arrestin domain-containing protein 1a [Esox lucius]|uniref:Arrestin domain containing 1 n=1 Tax=Esox lucius TaxID=8010 RepID=A0A3P8X837_ESOLU|nr:arrestin domain-containing protein 1a [Esox lucius]